jgi:hypothetical protein
MQSNSDDPSTIICRAIQEHRKLTFDYNGLRRIVVPYCYGVSKRDMEVLRAIQVGGASSSHGYGFGKLWTVSEMSALQVSAEQFVPNDPNYNPNDSAMKQVICRIEPTSSPRSSLASSTRSPLKRHR